MTFLDQLCEAESLNQSMLCVGLDPEPSRFPTGITRDAEGIHDFCLKIVEATADLAIAFKPQIAYFAAHGAEDQLERLMQHMRCNAPHVPVILDAKRGDIGSTAEQYAVEAFERFKADALTVNPYMGKDSVDPYLAYADKGVILLCRTSNPGGSDLQFLDVGGKKLYEHVAELVATKWNTTGQCALVVGATFPGEIARVREIVEEYDFTRDRLVVELTEDSYAHDREAALRTIEGLHAMGLRIVLDDIGAGYSSLSDLSTYPIDGVKIEATAADFDITSEDNQLVIRGRQIETGERDYLHRGIAARPLAGAPTVVMAYLLIPWRA